MSQKKREFGKIADIPAFVRLTNFLYSSKARLPLLQCMKNGIRLEGNSDEQPGIQQCHVLVKEMHILKHGESKTNTDTASGGDTPSRRSDGEPNGDQAMDMACLEPEVSIHFLEYLRLCLSSDGQSTVYHMIMRCSVLSIFD